MKFNVHAVGQYMFCLTEENPSEHGQHAASAGAVMTQREGAYA